MDLDFYKKQAQAKQKEHKKFLDNLKKKPPKNLDYITLDTHEEVFDEIDCLSCANCCKTTGPLFTEKDIERISKHLRLSPADFEKKYLRVDEDNDKVLQCLPCPFLAEDNTCLIYESARKPAANIHIPTARKSSKSIILRLKTPSSALLPISS